MKLSKAAALLREAGVADPLAEARRIFVSLGGLRREDTVGCDPDSDEPALLSAVERRYKREPLQYIIGEVGFYNELYKVGSGCLIPRQDTELLVDYAVKNLPGGAHFLDLCTGSGCVAISTLCATRDTTAEGVDLSSEALLIAGENARINGVADRLVLTEADALTLSYPDGSLDAVLSNPPYVTEAAYATLEPELYYEPRLALVGGGEDGADFYRAITKRYISAIKPSGFIAFEIGYDQRPALLQIAKEHGLACEFFSDFSGNDRVAVLKRRST